MGDVPHLSATALNMYQRCPAQFEFRYARGIIRPPGIALLVGGGVHGGAEAAMMSKAATGSDMPASDVVGAAVEAFDARLAAGGAMLDDEQRAAGEGITVARARDSTAALAEFYAVVAQPEYQPEKVEHRFSIPVPGVVEYVGVIDLVETNGRVTDWKTTSGRGPTQADADCSHQLTGYALAQHREAGKAPPEVRLDVLGEKNGKTWRSVLTTHRTRADYVAFLRTVEAAWRSIQAGSFPPTNPENWWCAKRFCGWADMCPYRNFAKGP